MVKIVQSITSGPLFFVQDRVGFNGKTFLSYTNFELRRITKEVLKAQRGESEKQKI